MQLNHLDILEQCFHEKFRGYDCKEVDAFLNLVAEDFKRLEEEVGELKKQMAQKEHLVLELREKSHSKGSHSTQESRYSPEVLKAKAHAIVNEARRKANDHKAKVEQELVHLRREVHKLRKDRESLIENIKSSARVFFTSQGSSGKNRV